MTSGGSSSPGSWSWRVGWFIATLGPPTAIGTAFRQSVAQHPLTATLLLFVYWAGLAIARFAGSIVGALADRWRSRLVERIDQISIRELSNFRKRYAEYIIGSERYIDQKGLPTVGFYTPELDDVFVDVSLVRRSPHQASANPIANLPADVTERFSIGDLLDREHPVVLALTGAAGSGKTTLLRHTARDICRTHQRRRRTSILLYLRDHARDIVDSVNNDLPALIDTALGQTCPQPPGWFQHQLREGDCVVLLDGLDEVAGDLDRRMVSSWVERQIAQYPRNDFVVTSRPHGYRTTPIQGAIVLQTRPFTEEQATTFVHSWYLAVERRSADRDGEDIMMLAAAEANDLLERLKGAPSLYELIVNPLLLTMIANVHRFRGALPGSRADLYRDICEVMLWRRHEAKKLPIDMPGEQKETVLRNLAFKMMKRRVSDLRASEVIAEITPSLSRLSTDINAHGFLEEVASSGLMVERERGAYSFAHQTFQEYLAASHIRDKGLIEVLTHAVDDVWWRETTLLYVSRADADPIVEACLSSGSLTALTLAFDCEEGKIDLAPELRRRLNEFLSAAEDQDADAEQRRLATGALISRLLRSVTPLGTGESLCTKPISCRIYRLFLNDVEAGGWIRKPDRPLRADNLPVIGVRGEDAQAFVTWLNDLMAEAKYRLPTLAEMAHVARVNNVSADESLSLWIYERGGRPQRWRAGNAENVYIVKAETLTSRLRKDVEGPNHPLLNLLFAHASAATSLISAYLREATYRDAPSIELIYKSQALARDVARDLGISCRGHTSTASPGTIADPNGCEVDRVRKDALSNCLSLVQALDEVTGEPYSRNSALIEQRLSIEHARNVISALTSDLSRAQDCILLDSSLPGLNLIRKRSFLSSYFEGDISPSHDLGHLSSALMGKSLTDIVSHVMGYDMRHAAQIEGRVDVIQREDAQAVEHAAFLRQLMQAAGVEYVSYYNIGSERFPTAVGTPSKEEGYPFSLESLAEQARTNRLFDTSEIQTLSTWGREYAEELQGILAPILTRQEALDCRLTGAIRLACVCLAAEAGGREMSHFGSKLIDIAACITMLETRLCDERPPNESIILAVA
jgi:hypothetical protein